MNTIYFAISFLWAITSSTPEKGIDSLLNVQRERGGEYSAEIFQALDNARRQGLTTAETEDLRFLITYLPLSDIVTMKVNDLFENIRLARVAKARFAWGEQVSEDLFRHFVLPHRISQEPFVRGWREQFLGDLTPRVEDLTMTEAALEVNHWCHENASFKRSSGRDQDPLTTIRSGFGRCEEEMILVIAAMRSIGIPARSCSTPYWAHCDNNHAWVEVWTNGKWHYLGGCEPKKTLNDAWFTRSAGRAILVVSTAFGDYYGDEPVLKRYGRSTLINSTAVYGDTHDMNVSLFDSAGEPMIDQRVIFSLYNYGTMMPILSLKTDSSGMCTFNSGKGTLLLSAGKDDYSSLMITHAETDQADLHLTTTDIIQELTEIDYTPPPELPPLPKLEPTPEDSLFKVRLANEKTLREHHFWTVWAKEAGLMLPDDAEMKPDSLNILPLVEALESVTELDSNEVLDIMEKARGNWGLIYHFLMNEYPVVAQPAAYQGGSAPNSDELKMRWTLIKTLEKKDLRDFTEEVLMDHFRYSTIDFPLFSLRTVEYIESLGEEAGERYLDYVVKPRIDWEPSVEWREDLTIFFNSHPKLIKSKKDKKLIDWQQENIVIEEGVDRLASSLTPGWILSLERGRERDVERLYIGLCRVRGIPSRFNPVTRQLECWFNNEWIFIKVNKDDEEDKKDKKEPDAKGMLYIDAKPTVTADARISENQLPESPEDWHSTPSDSLHKVLYFRDWAVEKWNTDHFGAVDFGYHEPYTKIEWPQELPVGLYCLTTGFRAKDGSAPIKLIWFEIKEGEDTRVNLEFR